MTPKQTDLNGNDVDIEHSEESEDLEMTAGEILYFREKDWFNPAEKCPECEDTWLECLRDDKYRLDDARYSPKLEKQVCFYCWESDQSYGQGTVFIFEPHLGEVTKWSVFSLEDMKWTSKHEWFDEIPDLDHLDWDFDSTDELCPIQFGYIKSDAWRGRYEAKADGWTSLHQDGILSMSSNEQKLKTFSDLILGLLWTANTNFAIIIGRTSNLFYQTYEIKTEGEIPDDIRLIMAKLKTELRDPTEYSMTALTGKSEDFTDKDRLFVQYAKRILNGESLSVIMEEIQG